ncbi:MAG: head decoration protein [Peptococcaceae bacterium]|nr:head decoration protein [Peptococcaceae bacterium]
MKVVKNTYDSGKEILYIPDHYLGLPVMVQQGGVATNGEGKKIRLAGSFLAQTGMLAVTTPGAEDAPDTSDVFGVLLRDTDVTAGAAPGTVIIHGVVNVSKLPDAPDDATKAALPLVKFM